MKTCTQYSTETLQTKSINVINKSVDLIQLLACALHTSVSYALATSPKQDGAQWINKKKNCAGSFPSMNVKGLTR